MVGRVAADPQNNPAVRGHWTDHHLGATLALALPNYSTRRHNFKPQSEKMSAAAGQAELYTFSLIKNLHRLVRCLSYSPAGYSNKAARKRQAMDTTRKRPAATSVCLIVSGMPSIGSGISARSSSRVSVLTANHNEKLMPPQPIRRRLATVPLLSSIPSNENSTQFLGLSGEMPNFWV